MRAATFAALALLAVGCAPTYPVTAPGAAGHAPAESSAPPQAPPPTPAPTPTPTPPPRSTIPQTQTQAPGRDACGATELQGLVGRLRTEIPVPLDPRRQRVACTTCPVTDDVDPTRLNFLFDAQTGRIRQIRCG